MRTQKGLTFVEILMVMLIIGVLAVSLTPVFTTTHNIGTGKRIILEQATEIWIKIQTVVFWERPV